MLALNRMKNKKIILALSLIGAIIVCVLIYNSKYKAKDIPVTITPNVILATQPAQIIYGTPVSLSIPAIDINATFKSVGITSEGAMDMPKNMDDIGWYDLGTKPGDIGSAVIAGHYGVKTGNSQAFNNIHKLVKGDKINIIDDKGNNISFVVRESKSFSPEAGTSEIFISRDGKAHLNLITCEGVWNNVTKNYSGRLVVFTDKE